MRTLCILVLLVAACSEDKTAKPDKGDLRERVESLSVEEALEAKRAAEQARDQAVKAARESEEQLDRVQADLQDLDKRVNGAVDSVTAAQTDADRAAANAKLKALQKDKQEMEQRIAAAKAAAAKAARLRGRTVSKECRDNPLAKGCD